jgi:predicted branched-subunit amino acid permease
MSRALALTVTKAIFIGLLLGSLVGGVLPVSAITACIVVAAALFILVVAPRPDVVYVLAGILIGALLAYLVPGLSFGRDVLIGLALVAAVTWL